MPNEMTPEARYRVAVGSKLLQRRRVLGLTLEDIADRSGHDPSVCGKAERGQSNLTIMSLMNFAQALEVEVRDLMPTFEEAGLVAVSHDTANVSGDVEGD